MTMDKRLLPTNLWLLCFSFDLHKDIIIPCVTLNEINDKMEQFCNDNPYLINRELKTCRCIHFAFNHIQQTELYSIKNFLNDFSFRMIGRIDMNSYPYHFQIREFYPNPQTIYKSELCSKNIKIVW